MQWGYKCSNHYLLWAVYQGCGSSVSTTRKKYPWVSNVVPCDYLCHKPAELNHHKKVEWTSHLTSKLEQRPVISFFTLKGLQRQQIQTELSDMGCDQAFRLSEVKMVLAHC
jgi:hypothetical protein